MDNTDNCTGVDAALQELGGRFYAMSAQMMMLNSGGPKVVAGIC